MRFNDAEPDPKKKEEAFPRYTAYARAHGLSRNEILERDKAIYPPWPTGRYLAWIDKKWLEWHNDVNGRNIRPGTHPPVSPEEHTRFDAWLVANLPPEVPNEEEDE